MAEYLKSLQMNWLRNLKLRDRLILTYSLLIILCVFVISTSSYYYSAKVIIDKSSEYIHGIQQQSSENIDKSLKGIEDAVNTFVSNTKIHNIVQYGKSLVTTNEIETVNIHDILSDIALLRREIDSIYIFSLGGKVYGTQSYIGNQNVSELRELAQTGSGRFVWLDADKKAGVIPAVKILKNSQFEEIGVILLNVRQSSIEQLFTWQKMMTEGDTFIVNDGGNVLISSSTGHTEALEKSLIEKILQSSDAFQKIEHKAGNQKFIVFVYQSMYNNWKYISMIRENDLIRDAKNIRYMNSILGFLFTILFLFISVAMAFRITIPIKKITQYMKEFEIKGSVKPLQFRNNDEISYLYATFTEMTERINKLIETIYEQEIMNKDQQLKILQSQINPHFLYNTFDIINWMAREKKVPEIGDIVKALSEIMRYTITSDDPEVLIEEELKHILHYLLIQKIRFDNLLEYDIYMDDRVKTCKILKLTLQPIIENAIKHGFKRKRKKCLIKVTGVLKENVIYITIQDNGAGISPEKLETVLCRKNKAGSQGGVGLINVDQRLKLKYGESFGLDIHSVEGHGTEVVIRVPAKEC